MTNKPITISDQNEYRQVMSLIEDYLHKATQGGGFKSLNDADKHEMTRLSALAKAYEDSIPLMPVHTPQTIPDAIKLEMYKRNLRQQKIAELLDISTTRLSEVMGGKRKVNIDLAKRLHTKLGIDAKFLLEHA